MKLFNFLREMFTKVNFVNYYSFVICCVFYQVSPDEAKPTTTSYSKAVEGYAMTRSTSSTPAASLLDCAHVCRTENCDTFSFNEQLHTCDTGACVTNGSIHQNPSNHVYLSCDESEGFRVFTSGTVRACVRESTNQVDYMTARENCRAKASHLYTVKSVEKQKILNTNFATRQWWVGLDDIVTEGTFRWVDDNTTSSLTWLRSIFGAGQPDNGNGNENCVRTIRPSELLYDVTCSLHTAYLCEKACFNYP